MEFLDPFLQMSKSELRFTDRSKAVLLLWIFYVFVLSYVCYVFVRVGLYVLCGHLLVRADLLALVCGV